MMGKPGPACTLFCLSAAALTLILSLICLPAAELLPAQVYPAKRDSGESLVATLPGSSAAMNFYAKMGVRILKKLPRSQPPPEAGFEGGEKSRGLDHQDVVQDWQSTLVADHGEKYGHELKANIEQALGGPENLKIVLDRLHADKNFVYSAYALFLGLALLAASIAIQAMGRWGAEEKTIIPVKK